MIKRNCSEKKKKKRKTMERFNDVKKELKNKKDYGKKSQKKRRGKEER